MKKVLCFILLNLLWVSALADSHTAVVVCVNDGSAAVPGGQNQVSDVIEVGFNNGSQNFDVGVDVGGVAGGASMGAYNSAGDTGTPMLVGTPQCGDTNIIFDGTTGPVADANGSPTWTIQFHYYSGPCYTTYDVSAVNNTGKSECPTVNWSNGDVTGPYNPIAAGATFSDSIKEACGQTYTITWSVQQAGLVSQEPQTNPNMPDLSTNEETLQNDTPTNEVLPQLPPDTSSNVLWTPITPNNNGPATDQSIHDLGNTLNNTLWSGDQQLNVDMSAVVSAIDSAKQQAHSDAGTVKSAVDTFREQNHSDLSGIANLLQNMTNGQGNVTFTNYALNSTLQSLVNGVNTNFQVLTTEESSNFQALLSGNGSLGQALTNAGNAVNGLADAISNIADITNLDIASEGTLEGGTNLLGMINSNLISFGTNLLTLTNYAHETTLEGISNLMAQLSTNAAGGGWSNGLTLDQLTNQVSAYQEQMSNSEDDALAQMSALTNQASQMGMGPVVAAVQGGLPGNVEYDSPGGLSPQVITLASGVSFSLGSNMPSYGPLRSVLAWATIVGLFLWNWRTSYSKIRDVFTANQARTAGTEVLGSNVNLSSAMLMAVAIFAAATAIPAFAVALLTNEISLFVSMGNVLSLFNGFGWGFSFLDQYIPLATVITAVTTRVVFNVVIDSIAAVVMAIKLFLVGL
jgi:hypothetical protein